MGSISTFNAYLTARQSAINKIYIAKTPQTPTVGKLTSSWTGSPNGAATPAAAAALTKATTGAYPFDADAWQNSGGSFQNMILGGDLKMSVAAGNASGGDQCWILCDRLSHSGGLDGTVTGAQTTNLPTAALTRYTTGAGVQLGIEIYTAVGATATTITTSYTDQAGASGHVNPLTVFGSSGFNSGSRFFWLPFASGDTGVRAVASVTIAASTLTAGNFGVTLFKPLIGFSISYRDQNAFDPIIAGNMFGGFPEIIDDACLFWLYLGTAGNASGLSGNLAMAEV